MGDFAFVALGTRHTSRLITHSNSAMVDQTKTGANRVAHQLVSQANHCELPSFDRPDGKLSMDQRGEYVGGGGGGGGGGWGVERAGAPRAGRSKH